MSTFALAILASLLIFVSAAAASVPPGELFSGLYHGYILYVDGSAELEILVELAPGPGGELVGTLDMPAYDMEFKPLEGFRADGRQIYFSYRNFSEVRGANALFEFEGELSPDGQVLSGDFLESRGKIPFRLQRIGDAGSPRPVLEKLPLADLSDAGDELRSAFNAHPDQVRLILLLSPT